MHVLIIKLNSICRLHEKLNINCLSDDTLMYIFSHLTRQEIDTASQVGKNKFMFSCSTLIETLKHFFAVKYSSVNIETFGPM